MERGSFMRNIWFTVMYDGSSFAGFQRQPNGLAVQEVLEEVLERLTGAKTAVYFVARTDAGVHAWGQECTFFTESSIPGGRVRFAMNALLPPMIRVCHSEEVPEDFSVRKRNTGKTYGYLFSEDPYESPFLQRYCWPCGKVLDVERMEEAASALTGVHDFTSFRGNNSVPSDPCRMMYDIRLIRDRRHIRLYVTGEGFLYHMVRNIAGALYEAGLGKMDGAAVHGILAGKDRRLLPAATAPAAGLALLRVYFSPITEEDIDETLAMPLFPWNP